ncbi:MAG: hypothetical protein RR303_04420 [Bacteroidales bacterium]
MTDKKELLFSPELVAPLYKSLRWQYNLFLISLILFIVLLSKSPVSLPAVTGDMAIQLQSFSVLLTLGLIPFSLWYFGKQISRISDLLDWAPKEKEYRKNSLLRLALLWLTIFINITFYFLTYSYSFLLCAGMGLVASMFCIPSLKKIQCDLFPEVEKEDDKEDSQQQDEQE